jgi:hypothetical protein
LATKIIAPNSNYFLGVGPQGGFAPGKMEYWGGMLERWSIGAVEYWSGGVLEYWSDAVVTLLTG